MTRSGAHLGALARLPVLAGLLAGAGCSSTSDLPPDVQTGAELYVSQSCALCHGADGRSAFWRPGPDLVPSLDAWTVDALAEYLADPAAWAARDPRLDDDGMPGFPQLSVDERERLARFVLSLGDAGGDA
ncbi:MAG: cytochrome c [Planctomycetes bacterium]|nr:cytochrome c [Planctomycetota bacterium]